MQRQQTSCFVTEDGEWAVDFIGRLEHFDEDIERLFEIVNKRRCVFLCMYCLVLVPLILLLCV